MHRRYIAIRCGLVRCAGVAAVALALCFSPRSRSLTSPAQAQTDGGAGGEAGQGGGAEPARGALANPVGRRAFELEQSRNGRRGCATASRAGAGQLTAKGRALAEQMGTFYGSYLAGLVGDACPAASDVFVWADLDERTQSTGRALLKGFRPSCDGARYFHVATTKRDRIFHPVTKDGACKLDAARAEKAILERAGGDIAAYIAAQKLGPEMSRREESAMLRLCQAQVAVQGQAHRLQPHGHAELRHRARQGRRCDQCTAGRQPQDRLDVRRAAAARVRQRLPGRRCRLGTADAASLWRCFACTRRHSTSSRGRPMSPPCRARCW